MIAADEGTKDEYFSSETDEENAASASMFKGEIRDPDYSPAGMKAEEPRISSGSACFSDKKVATVSSAGKIPAGLLPAAGIFRIMRDCDGVLMLP